MIAKDTRKAIQNFIDWAAVDSATDMYRTVPRPPNSFTNEEYAERYGLKLRTATGQLASAVKSGRFLRHRVSLRFDNGKNRTMNVYTVVAKVSGKAKKP